MKAIALTLIIAAAWAPSAGAATPPPLVVPPPVTAQAAADRMVAWLSRTLRAEVKPRPVHVTDVGYFAAENAGEYHAHTDEIQVRPWVESSIQWRIEGEPWRGRVELLGPAVLMHELLHRGDTVACWGDWPSGVNVEEGIVDAIAADLMPAWSWAHWRVRGMSVPYYTADVAALRAASARATGSKTWRAWSARSWRYRLWGASCEGRAAMLAEVRA